MDTKHPQNPNVDLEQPGRRKRGRPHRRFMDVLKEGMKRAGVTEEGGAAQRRL